MGGVLGKISKARHATVAAAIGGTTLLTGAGVIGGGDFPERYDAWQSVVTPVGETGVRVVDTFDQDFGDEDRRGHERYIQNDFGAPVDVVASSPDAPDDLSVVDIGVETRVRVGDPDVTISGQHRYTIGYTLPDAKLGNDVLSLDVLSADGEEIERFELIVTGFVLDDPVCLFGRVGAETECDWVERRDGFYRAVVEPLDENTGVTVEGDVAGFVEPEDVPVPAIPERREGTNRGLAALGMAGLGAVGAVPVYRWARRKGRNEVYAGGAADAAYGELPRPRADGSAEPPPPVTLVHDDELGDLATIEFVPPKGIDPWQAQVLLTEKITDDTVEAWLSGLAGREAVEIAESGENLSIGSGPARGDLATGDAKLLDSILSLKDPYVTGKYDKKFAGAWSSIRSHQKREIANSGWWRHGAPGSTIGGSITNLTRLLPFMIFGFIWFGSAATAIVGLFSSWPLAIAIGLLFPAVVAYFVYRALLPSRSAQGSALALRTESFRRFLHASEAQHVEWAWGQGVLREYSGWAVALGEADAWSKALDRANVPAPARLAAGPIIIHNRGSSMRTSRTAPQQSGSGGGRGGGGFRSGSVGGGGGGSSRGSW